MYFLKVKKIRTTLLFPFEALQVFLVFPVLSKLFSKWIPIPYLPEHTFGDKQLKQIQYFQQHLKEAIKSILIKNVLPLSRRFSHQINLFKIIFPFYFLNSLVFAATILCFIPEVPSLGRLFLPHSALVCLRDSLLHVHVKGVEIPGKGVFWWLDCPVDRWLKRSLLRLWKQPNLVTVKPTQGFLSLFLCGTPSLVINPDWYNSVICTSCISLSGTVTLCRCSLNTSAYWRWELCS